MVFHAQNHVSVDMYSSSVLLKLTSFGHGNATYRQNDLPHFKKNNHTTSTPKYLIRANDILIKNCQ